MNSRVADYILYGVLFMLCFVFGREAYLYIRFDLLGYAVPTAQAAIPAKAEDAQKTLKLLTYNVLAHPVFLDQRVPPLFKVMEKAEADIIALQEAGGWFMPRLEKEEWAKKYHWVSSAPYVCHGQFIMSRYPPEKAVCYGLPGPQGRRALVAWFKIGGRVLAVATAHMESPLEASAVRAEQLEVIFERMGAADDYVMMADVNFGDGEPEESRVPAGYVDMWKKLRKDEPGFTWDNEKSDMAGKSAERFQGEPSRRLDRIFVKSPVWQPQEVRIVGDEPVTEGRKDVFPSDHFGVAGTLVRE